MEFVVLLLAVLTITFTLVIARPSDTKDHTKNGKYTAGDSYTPLKFMLPVAAYNLTDKYVIEINGTLDLTHENFAAMLLSGVKESASCKLNFNFEKNSGLEILSELENYQEFLEYSLGDTDKSLNPEFRLNLQAKDTFGEKNFIITFDRTEVGNCKVDSLDNLSHIIFNEGVKKIHSIKFNFLD